MFSHFAPHVISPQKRKDNRERKERRKEIFFPLFLLFYCATQPFSSLLSLLPPKSPGINPLSSPLLFFLLLLFSRHCYVNQYPSTAASILSFLFSSPPPGCILNTTTILGTVAPRLLQLQASTPKFPFLISTIRKVFRSSSYFNIRTIFLLTCGKCAHETNRFFSCLRADFCLMLRLRRGLNE